MTPKTYKVLYRTQRQYNEETKTFQKHRTVKSTLPVGMLAMIGVDENEPGIVVELDMDNDCLVIKKA